MRTYRVLFLDQVAHIVKPPIDIECTNDREASQKAEKLVDGHDTELWEDDRLIGLFHPKK